MVKKLKKLLATLLAGCMTLGLLAGCGGQANSAAASGSAPADASAEVQETKAPEEAPAAPEASTSAEEAASVVDEPAVGEGEITQHAKDIFGVEEAPEEVSYPMETDESRWWPPSRIPCLLPIPMVWRTARSIRWRKKRPVFTWSISPFLPLRPQSSSMS